MTIATQPSYQRRVSFDNVTNIPPAYHSFTLKQSSLGFKKTRRSRTYMVAIDLLQEITDSLSFTLRSLMDEGDEIIVVGVYPQLSNNEEDPKQKAEEIIDWIMKSHQGDKIQMIVELTFGRPEVALEEMIRMYQPSMLIVGSRNKLKYKHAYSGTGIFKYRLKHSSVPIVIVRDKPMVEEKVVPPKKLKKSFSLLNCTHYYSSE
ncbi:hypothetical protein MFLAVUS_003593 [Mucor flavus]|uniref:UspA domain-containing protein n=1 Tax=Mucor flavus TaxID=439312 RepID=A0ABP9YTI2_9FUNG